MVIPDFIVSEQIEGASHHPVHDNETIAESVIEEMGEV